MSSPTPLDKTPRSPSDEHSRFSSYREALLEHLFVGELMRNLWRSGCHQLEVLKPQVDNAGYDLVLEANGVTRHVQLKSSFLGSKTARVNVHTALKHKPNGCVIWIRFDAVTLELKKFLWLGGAPGEGLGDIDKEFSVAKHTKGDSRGKKLERPALRVVPGGAFDKVTSVEELAIRLFGEFR